jgi:hypothetical protein
MAVLDRNFTFRQAQTIRYSRTKHALRFYLRSRTTAQTEYVWVVLLIICWNSEYLNSLSLRDTNRFKKAKYWNSAHFCSEKRKISFRRVHPGSLIGLIQREEWSEWKPKYGIELPTSIRIISVEAVETLGDFKHINSLMRRDTWYDISKKKHVKDTRW